MNKAHEQASTQNTQMVYKNLKRCSTLLKASKCKQNIFTFQWTKIKKVICYRMLVKMYRYVLEIFLKILIVQPLQRARSIFKTCNEAIADIYLIMNLYSRDNTKSYIKTFQNSKRIDIC